MSVADTSGGCFVFAQCLVLAFPMEAWEGGFILWSYSSNSEGRGIMMIQDVSGHRAELYPLLNSSSGLA